MEVAPLSNCVTEKKILVMGPEIRHPHQRGIYAYTKSLLAALKHLGLTTGFFTQASIPSNPHVLHQQIIHSLANAGDFDWYRGRNSWMKSKYRRLAAEVRNSATTYDAQWRFLENVDYFYNSPHFFDAVEFGKKCPSVAPKDLAGRLSKIGKHLSKEVERDAMDVDFVAAAGYRMIITSSPTSVRSRTGKVKIVQTLHDLIPFEYPYENVAPEAYLESLQPTLCYADAVLAMSKHTAVTTIRVFPEYASKCAIVYQSNPIESVLERVGQERTTQARQLRIAGVEVQKYLLYLGVVERRKNIEVVMRAFSRLNPNLGLKLVVAGAMNEAYARLTGLGEYLDSKEARADGIIYAGYVSEEQKVALLQSATALIFPSFIEGFGLPVLEAMSAGCPVIATRGSSIPEVGGDAVLYLEDPCNAGELSELMHRVACDKAVASALRDEGLRRAKHFTVEAFARQLCDWGAATGLLEKRAILD